jgi:hypothetical protein
MKHRLPSSLAKLGALLLIGVVFLGCMAIGGYLYVREKQANETQELAQSLREALINSCETSGNTLRSVVRRTIREDLRASQDLALFRELFPQLSERRLRELVDKSVEANLATYHALRPVDCEKAYPPE